ncbi:hypothetical protein EGW08_011718, partial [Elysia chlorotica]
MAAKNAKYTFGLLQTPTDVDRTSSSRRNISTSSHVDNSSGPDTGPSKFTGWKGICTPVLQSKYHHRRQIRTPASAGRGQKTPRVASTTNTPYTASSHVSTETNSSTIIAIVEGRGQARGEIGITSLDLKQPVLVLTQFSDCQTYSKTLSTLYYTNPLEILVPNTMWESSSNKLFSLINDHFPTVTVSSVQRRYFNESKGLQCVKHLCAAEYKSIELQISSKYYCLATAAALLKYVEHIQNIIFAPSSLKVVFKGCNHITMIGKDGKEEFRFKRNIASSDSLYGVLNHTQTQGGARLLRSNILQPVKDEETICLRQHAVMELTEKEDLFFNLQSVIGRFLDIGYIVGLCIQTPKQETARTAESKLNCVLMLKHVLQLVTPLRENLSNCENQLFKTYYQALESSQYKMILDKIGEVISEDAHFQKGLAQQRAQKCCAVKVKKKINLKLKVYLFLYFPSAMVRQLAEHYKLPLRMSYSSLRGFHIQMNSSSGFQDSLPPVFIKVAKFKSTLSFTTMDLVRAISKLFICLILTLIFVSELLTKLHEHMGCLYELADIVGMVDMLLSFAHCATLSSYVCPEFTDTLAIKQGVHPILQRISTETVVANDTYASEHSNFIIITGPNMGGKSTYLRQVALLQIMAQIGSFVPAQYASFRIADQIFSRIGSDGHMESNSSTFTLEMKETNYIIQNVTNNCLVIIDELGRGTSAEEGVGLCWAVCEFLLKTQAFSFFVTHFKQLAELNRNYPNVANYFFEVQRTFNAEANCEKISFTHVLSRGITPETHYGLHLAKLSSMPLSVVEEARKKVTEIESQKQRNLQHDKELIEDHAVFNLATRLIQLAKNSRMDEDSLRAYMASLKRKYLADLARAESDPDQTSTSTKE